jgi:hypothetical protein
VRRDQFLLVVADWRLAAQLAIQLEHLVRLGPPAQEVAGEKDAIPADQLRPVYEVGQLIRTAVNISNEQRPTHLHSLLPSL